MTLGTLALLLPKPLLPTALMAFIAPVYWVSAGWAAPSRPQTESELAPRSAFDAITHGVDERPIPVVLTEGSCGVLEIGWNEHVLPILTSDAGVFVAASKVGKGRVVAFGGQDFICFDEDATFIGIEGNDALVRNAVQWASDLDGSRRPRVLVDNDAVGAMLEDTGAFDVHVAALLKPRAPQGLIDARDWSTDALAEIDVAVVLVNEWDSTHIGANEISSLHDFVRRGGGLLIAGSSFHWDGDDPDEFPAHAILAGSGIRWNDDEEPDLASARIEFRPLSSPIATWKAYLAGEPVAGMDLARLSDIFVSIDRMGRDDEVDRALERLIAETPKLPVAADDPRARLSADVASSLDSRAWPSAHPWAATFPGLPSAGARRIERVVELDPTWTGARPLGLYAPPGELITLQFNEPPTVGMWVVIGDSHDDLRSNDDHEEWLRAPYLQTQLDVDASEVSVSNPYGGPLYVVVRETLEGPISVSVKGAIAMAVFTLGESTLADWKRDLGRGAPQAILQALGSVRMVVPSAAAAEVEDPAWVLEFWNGFHASHAELAQEPAPRRFESHWIYGPQVGSGYANVSPVAASQNPGSAIDRISFPLGNSASALSTDTGEDDYWTLGHELGHQFQTDDWIGGDLTEVAVNLFALYTQNTYIHGGSEFETVGFEEDYYKHEDLIDFRWDDVGEWEKLQLYRQLVLVFGWSAFKRTFASYYQPEFPREEYGGHTDGFAIRFSAIVERDLTGFLEHWEYPLSESAAEKIRSFGYEAWMPPGW